MSKKPIKSSLFRFVTLRSPQAIEDKENKAGFILPSSDVKTASAYYSAIDGVDQTDEAARKTALEGADSDPSFVLIDGKASLKAISSDLYSFSSWLMRNKNYLTYESVASNMPSGYLEGTLTDVVLDTAEEARVWDNLLYQTIYKTSVTLREGLIQMLIANQFVQDFKAFHDTMSAGLAEGEVVVFTDQDEKEFVKRANASVVIEKEVLLSSEVETVEAVEELPLPTQEFLKDDLRASLAEQNIITFNQAIEELRKEEAIYNQKEEEAYQASLSAHQASVKTALAAVKTVDAEGNISYPEADLPTFSYDAPTLNLQDSSGEVFSKTVGDPSTVISTDTVDVLEGKEFENISSFSEAYKTLQDCITFEKNILAKRTQNEKRTFTVGGSKISFGPIDLIKDTPYCYAGVLKRAQKMGAEKVAIDLNVFTGRTDSHISSATLTLTHDSSSTVVATVSDVQIESKEEKVLYRFFMDNTNPLSLGMYTVSGTLNFANGDVVDFSNKVNYFKKPPTCGFVTEYYFTGCGDLQGGSGNSTNTPVNKPSLKGVSNLGIADYRRVEQEICCYVPGEVSHIENILAKEYKEKSTRSLVSSEITTEQTRESEVENLTDTTSTERNELSAEASSVIDQQNSQDYGASASVGYNGKWNFNASATYGNSSSNATSLSNSEAQTYAQEVTERALERVVQKVSSKRTSRVLREFEENNKHGFDNTKGENHITGVYRWVDKVYENQIVNYGKRLMYEFSIPEPARYLKEALLLSTESSKTDLGLLEPSEPTHPSNTSFKVKSAKDLTSANYQQLAALYNAEISPKPETYAYASTSFSFTTPETNKSEWDEIAADNKEVDVPEGYETVSAKTRMYYPIDPGFGAFAIVGNQKFGISDLSSKAIASFTETIPVSYSSLGHHSGSINVEIKCKLTTQGVEQWQNDTYNAIMNAYYDRVNEYNDFKRADQDLSTESEGERLKFNPAFNRGMEKREFKRLAIELLTKSTDISISRDNFVTIEGQPEINDSEEFEKHAAVVKFFEQAFDWEIMSYQLYPYYYADKKNWKDLIIEKEDADPIFQAFLQSGMSRMVVPVRPGFESAINWYMSTGEIWNGQGLVTDINDDLYLSIVDEMLEPLGAPVGQPWKTRVPTSLTIVQAKSAYLDETGLPCDPDCGEITNISGTNLVLSGGTGSNASDGVGADTVGEDNTIA